MSEIRNDVCPICGMPMNKEQQVCPDCSYKIKLGESIDDYCAKHGGIWHNYEIEKPMIEGVAYKICVTTYSWNCTQSQSYRIENFVNDGFKHSPSEKIVSWFEPYENENVKEMVDNWSSVNMITADEAKKRTKTKNKEYIDELRKIHNDIISACENGEYDITYDYFLSEKAISILEERGYNIDGDYGQGQAYTKISWK